jgi:hypothetical protein
MAATIRAIMPKLQYPPFRKETKDSKGKRNQDGCSGDNLAYTAIIQAMLHHAKGIRPDATEITVSPAVKQIADVCQVSIRTVQRYLSELKEHGTITARNKGSKVSSDFTIHVGHLGVTLGDTSDSPDRSDTIPPSAVTQGASEVTQSGLEVTPGVALRSKASGVNPQDNHSQEKATPTSLTSNPDGKSESDHGRSPESKDNTRQDSPRKSSSKSGPFGKLKPITPEMEAHPTFIAWRAAKKSRQEWDQELRRIGFKGPKEEGRDKYIEAKDAVNYWDDELVKLDRIVHAMREEQQ